jgi:hypothetical protein
MQRLRGYEIILGGLIFSTFWAIVLWQSNAPSYAEICEQTKEGAEKCTHYGVALFFIVKIGKFLNDFSPLITGIATIFIARFTQTLWRATKENILHSHHIERAYISGGGVPETTVLEPPPKTSVVFPGATNIPTLDVPIRVLTGRFELHVNNYGKTPGELLEIAVGFCEEGKIPPEPAYERKPHHDWIQPGRGHRPITWIDFPEGRPIVYGRFYYLDIFGRHHSSGFIQHGSRPIVAPRAYTNWD